MKKILLLFTLSLSMIAKAQDPELISNTWYLHNLIIDDEDHIPNNIGQHLDIYFWVDDDITYFTLGDPWGICSYITTFESNDQFMLDDEYVCLLKGICYSEAFTNFFLNGYGGFYWDHLNSFMGYEIITEEDNSKTLVVTNPDGNRAIYNTQQITLSNKDFNTLSFTLFPNPVNDQLFITTDTGTIKSKRVYTISGKRILEDTTGNAVVDVSNLQNGVYFLEVITETGSAIKKIIKK